MMHMKLFLSYSVLEWLTLMNPIAIEIIPPRVYALSFISKLRTYQKISDYPRSLSSIKASNAFAETKINKLEYILFNLNMLLPTQESTNELTELGLVN